RRNGGRRFPRSRFAGESLLARRLVVERAYRRGWQYGRRHRPLSIGYGIRSRYFASAISGTALMRSSALFEIGESTSISMNASLPRCLREQYNDAMLIPSSAMMLVTSE